MQPPCHRHATAMPPSCIFSVGGVFSLSSCNRHATVMRPTCSHLLCACTQKISVPNKSADNAAESCIKISTETYGTSTWELFYIMMKETDKTAFYRHLQLFRNNLTSHGQHKLLEYFDSFYFPDHRIVQWAMWYRFTMYNCKWLANTNMHVESWHNFLKTHILDRKNNVRVDSLMFALRKAESVYVWKWSRVRAGWVTNSDAG